MTCRNSLLQSGRSYEIDDLTMLSDNHPLHPQNVTTSSGSDVIMTSPFSIASASSTSGSKFSIHVQCTCDCLLHIILSLGVGYKTYWQNWLFVLTFKFSKHYASLFLSCSIYLSPPLPSSPLSLPLPPSPLPLSPSVSSDPQIDQKKFSSMALSLKSSVKKLRSDMADLRRDHIHQTSSFSLSLLQAKQKIVSSLSAAISVGKLGSSSVMLEGFRKERIKLNSMKKDYDGRAKPMLHELE